MRSTIVITPESNIYKDTMIDLDLYTTITVDSHKESLFLYDRQKESFRFDYAINLSLYNDLLVLNNVKHRIVRMLSK